MRNSDFVVRHLRAWGWYWSDRMERDQLPQSIQGTLAGKTGGSPFHSTVPMCEADWMRPDVLKTHACVCALNDMHRAVVWRHFVEHTKPVKVHCAELGVASSVYYQRLGYAKRHLSRSMAEGVSMDNVHMEVTPLVGASSGAGVNLRRTTGQRSA